MKKTKLDSFRDIDAINQNTKYMPKDRLSRVGPIGQYSLKNQITGKGTHI